MRIITEAPMMKIPLRCPFMMIHLAAGICPIFMEKTPCVQNIAARARG